MAKKFKLGKIIIDSKSPPLIICEIGINHNGNLKTAKKMVDAAKKAGAKIIKHQTHIPDEEMSFESKKIKPGNSKSNIYSIIKQCSLNEKDEFELKKYTEKKGLFFLSSPFSSAAVDRLVKFNVEAFKIGSGEFNNIPFIKYVCSFKKPMILSTGMNNMQQIHRTVKILKNYNINFILMHTTNLYPTPHELVRLKAMKEMMIEFPNNFIGLSDHTTDNYSSYFAIAMGAKVIEKHFTDHKKRKGPDISCSMDPNDFKKLNRASELYNIMNNGKKIPAKEESVTSNFAFGSVVSIKEIKKGEKLNKKNIWIKRPGTGYFKSEDFYKLIGKTAKRDIKSNVQLKKVHVS